MELTNDKELQGRLLEAARTVFQDQHVNINPLPAVMCEFQQFAKNLRLSAASSKVQVGPD